MLIGQSYIAIAMSTRRLALNLLLERVEFLKKTLFVYSIVDDSISFENGLKEEPMKFGEVIVLIHEFFN